MQEKFLNRMTKNIGFMQGRLSPMDDGKIQSFPWKYWQNEFALASKYNFDLIEWCNISNLFYIYNADKTPVSK